LGGQVLYGDDQIVKSPLPVASLQPEDVMVLTLDNGEEDTMGRAGRTLKVVDLAFDARVKGNSVSAIPTEFEARIRYDKSQRKLASIAVMPANEADDAPTRFSLSDRGTGQRDAD
jgi:hypothetical protein